MRALTKFRDTLLAILPRWARRWRAVPAVTGVEPKALEAAGVGYRLATTFGVLYDAVGDAAVAALAMRYPGLYSNETLSLTGRHRAIRRGLNESDTSYAARQLDYRNAHKREGDRYETLVQVQASFLPDVPPVRVIDNDGDVYLLTGSVYSQPTPLAWNWDGHTTYDSRYWVAVDNSYVGLVEHAELWDDQYQADGQEAFWDSPPGLWDFLWNPMPGLLVDLIEAWRPPHAFCDSVVVVNDPLFWTDLPDGDWDNWDNRSLYAYYIGVTVQDA